MSARLLSIAPTTVGFAYVVLEAPARLIVWGLATARDDERWIARVESLLASYAPETIVSPHPESCRSERSRQRLDDLQTIALLRGIWTVAPSKESVRGMFPEARSKHDIAVALVDRFPELRPRLPRKRKPWQSEDSRMKIFDALALMLAALPTDPLPDPTPSYA
jgi:hypothetical protein